MRTLNFNNSVNHIIPLITTLVIVDSLQQDLIRLQSVYFLNGVKTLQTKSVASISTLPRVDPIYFEIALQLPLPDII